MSSCFKEMPGLLDHLNFRHFLGHVWAAGCERRGFRCELKMPACLRQPHGSCVLLQGAKFDMVAVDLGGNLSLVPPGMRD